MNDPVTTVPGSALWYRPRHEGMAFGNIPATVMELLAPGSSQGQPLDRSCWASKLPTLPRRRVISVFVDAFGWCFVNHWRLHPALRRFQEEGTVSVIDSLFPSSTPAHMTTFRTGFTPERTAILGPGTYDPTTGGIFEFQRFRYPGQPMDSLVTLGTDVSAFFPPRPMGVQLRDRGVECISILPAKLPGYCYTTRTLEGFTIQGEPTGGGYTSYEQLLTLLETLETTAAPQLIDIYIKEFDALLHRYGVGAPESKTELARILQFLEQLVERFLQEGTTILIFADHGQVDLDSNETVFLEDCTPGLLRLLRRDRSGTALGPGGTERCMFLYVEDAHISEATQLLAEALQGIAIVRSSESLLREGYFGTGTPHPHFLRQAGTVSVLPLASNLVWLSREGPYAPLPLKAGHGGTLPAEREIPFMALHG